MTKADAKALLEAVSRLAEGRRCEPGPKELAEHLNWSQARVARALALSANVWAKERHRRLPAPAAVGGKGARQPRSSADTLTSKGGPNEPRRPVVVGLSDDPGDYDDPGARAVYKDDNRKQVRHDLDTGARGLTWWHKPPLDRGDHRVLMPATEEDEEPEDVEEPTGGWFRSWVDDRPPDDRYAAMADRALCPWDEPAALWEAVLCTRCHDEGADGVDGLGPLCRHGKGKATATCAEPDCFDPRAPHSKWCPRHRKDHR